LTKKQIKKLKHKQKQQPAEQTAATTTKDMEDILFKPSLTSGESV
jgi:hypothetical protein